MTTSFDEMLANGSLQAVVQQAAQEEKAEQVAAVKKMTSVQRQTIYDYVSHQARQCGTKSTVFIGCVLYLHGVATDVSDERDQQDKLLEEIGVSRSQRPRLKALWRNCGPALVAEPELFGNFCAESLKLIGADREPDEVRVAGFDYARAGSKVTIKVAKELIDRFREDKKRPSQVVEELDATLDDVDENLAELSEPIVVKSTIESGVNAAVETTPDEPKAPGAVLATFKGRVVRLIAEPIQPQSETSLEDFITDVERFLVALKRKRAQSIQGPTRSKAG